MDEDEFGKNGGENALLNLETSCMEKLSLKMEKTIIYMGCKDSHCLIGLFRGQTKSLGFLVRVA